MAYNLESLVQILEEILHPVEHGLPWLLSPPTKPLVKSLLEKTRFLKEFFDNSSLVTGNEFRRLESQIRDVTYHAENVIQSHLADKLSSKNKGERIVIFAADHLLEDIDDYYFLKIVDKMVTIMDGGHVRSALSSHHVLPGEDLNPKKIVVGIDGDVLQLKHWLMSQQSTLKIMPIVGMGGIGKTTLAQTLYDDPSVISHFDARIWVVLSQRYNMRDILLRLLKSVGEPTYETTKHSNDILALCLHKSLWGRRYLIVLDDMWSVEAWDDVKICFPDEKNGSRILVTTRELRVANYANPRHLHHRMKFLNEVESWTLLCRKVFIEENFLPELEDVGKSIAKDCRGLPLAIHVVGGVLQRLEKTREAWLQIAKDVRSSVVNNDETFSNVLSLSYNYLPNHLKPCLLYMSAFPEDYHIRASKIIMLWIAEGFIKPISGKGLEEAAEIYLKELVQRNLLLVSAIESKWKVKRYLMHDLLRHFCIKKAKEEKFLHDLTYHYDSHLKELLHLPSLDYSC